MTSRARSWRDFPPRYPEIIRSFDPITNPHITLGPMPRSGAFSLRSDLYRYRNAIVTGFRETVTGGDSTEIDLLIALSGAFGSLMIRLEHTSEGSFLHIEKHLIDTIEVRNSRDE